MGDSPASRTTALIVAVELPTILARLRLEHDETAQAGIAAHLTLMYPFVPPSAIDAALPSVRTAIGAHTGFPFQLVEVSLWPDTVYLRPEPAAPFERLHGDLAAAFPDYPLYGGAYPFTPHVTITEFGPDASPEQREAVIADIRRAAAGHLPLACHADAMELIEQDLHGRWSSRLRIALAGG